MPAPADPRDAAATRRRRAPFWNPLRGVVSLPRRQWQYFDWWLFAGVLATAVFGLATLWGTTHRIPRLDYLPARQAFGLAIGLIALFAMLVVEPAFLRKVAPLAYLGAIFLLMFLLVGGVSIKGARSWMTLPGGFRFQPAEFAKLAVVLMLARRLEPLDLAAMPWRRVLPLLAEIGAMAGLPFILIALQPDLGTAAVLIPVVLIVLFAAGLRARYLVAGLLIVALVGAASYPLLKPYQQRRLLVHIDPEQDPRGAGYNIIQAKIALGSGGLTGKGLGAGTQSYFGFLPEHQTDFIFNSLGEQLGAAGCLALLACYLFLLWRGLRLALHARTFFSAYLAVGLLAIFAGHVLLNVFIAVQILPVTGLPLPFFSAGGSFMVTNFVIFGIVLNVGMRRHLF